MKKSLLFVLALSLLLALAACGECEHDWKNATCEAPKTCALCGQTQGDKAEHDWKDATCTAPKTCSECDATEGDAVGHKFADATCLAPKTCTVCKVTEGEKGAHIWLDASCLTVKTCALCKATEGEKAAHTWAEATCEAPKTCTVCKATEGETAPHTWLDATTEAPKTCSVCKTTEGDRIVTDSRFNTESAKAVFGSWKGESTLSGAEVGYPDFPGEHSGTIYIEFTNTGVYRSRVELKDEAAFKESLKVVARAIILDQLKAETGMDEAAIESLFYITYGMSLDDYVSLEVDSMDLQKELSEEGVYYVEGNQVYQGESWDGEFESREVILEGDTMTVKEFMEGMDLTLTRTAQ